MTLQEFKAWFDGFTENIGEAPTKKQWARIKARVNEIDGTAITYPYPWTWTCGNGVQSTTFTVTADTGFNSAQAMYALGTSDGISTISSGNN